MEDPVIALVRFLVIKRLAGNSSMLMAVKEYFVDGVSPSSISYKYKVSKFRVRGYIQRVTEKTRNSYLASSIIKQVFPLILEIEPAVIKVNEKYVCLLCDQSFNNEITVENHLRRKHEEHINKAIKEVLESVKELSTSS
ncbi:MAG: zinc finger RNA-binding protein [Desulfurococcaceae archaeon]|nr:zinc finger RNA-binding protein [Desulfurococcaceae archaeon]